MDLKINARLHELRRASWALIASAAALQKTDPVEAEETFRSVIGKVAEYARLDWESGGLFAELAAELYPSWKCHLNAQDPSALGFPLLCQVCPKTPAEKHLTLRDLFLWHSSRSGSPQNA